MSWFFLLIYLQLNKLCNFLIPLHLRTHDENRQLTKDPSNSFDTILRSLETLDVQKGMVYFSSFCKYTPPPRLSSHGVKRTPDLTLPLSPLLCRRFGRNPRHSGRSHPNRLVRIPLRDPSRHGSLLAQCRHGRDHQLRDRPDAVAGIRGEGAGRQS